MGSKKKGADMKRLAEAVILSAVEDLWDETEKKESIGFFIGNGFPVFAEMAEMSQADRSRLLAIIRPVLGDSRTQGSRLRNIVSKLPRSLHYGLASGNRDSRVLPFSAA